MKKAAVSIFLLMLFLSEPVTVYAGGKTGASNGIPEDLKGRDMGTEVFGNPRLPPGKCERELRRKGVSRKEARKKCSRKETEGGNGPGNKGFLHISLE